MTALSATILTVALWTPLLCGGDLSTYRGFRVGMSLSEAAQNAGVQPTEARLIHAKPVPIQELDWQPRSSVLADAAKTDPVKDVLLCFFDGKLFRMVVTYDRYRVEGMTAEDMTEAISSTYGVASKPAGEVAYVSNYGSTAAVLARWENSEYSYNLVRTGDQASFALVLYSKKQIALAELSTVEAVRLEANEAPQREMDRQKKREEEERLTTEKARSVNKPNFRL